MWMSVGQAWVSNVERPGETVKGPCIISVTSGSPQLEVAQFVHTAAPRCSLSTMMKIHSVMLFRVISTENHYH